ncbi:hypothetical protein [Lysinibacillus phage vB_LspM-01]|nr:hypothetical protein [Lysinibacillus phage vB_LspM-01]
MSDSIVSFEFLDDNGQLIAYEDVYFEIGDAIIHIENISDYLMQGYGIDTYELSDAEVIELVEKEYGTKHIRRL